jgi:flagellar protein FliO/FliZ
MPQAYRRRRAMRAGLGLAVVLTLGFAADALVLMTTRARADATSNRATADNDRQNRFAGRLSTAVRPGGSDLWTMAMIGITLTLAACGGIVAAGRRLLPQGPGAGMQVVGRVSLSPKQTVYMLRVGQRVLLVGVGPQGAPTLISELDDLAEIEPDPPHGDHP